MRFVLIVALALFGAIAFVPASAIREVKADSPIDINGKLAVVANQLAYLQINGRPFIYNLDISELPACVQAQILALGPQPIKVNVVGTVTVRDFTPWIVVSSITTR